MDPHRQSPLQNEIGTHTGKAHIYNSMGSLCVGSTFNLRTHIGRAHLLIYMGSVCEGSCFETWNPHQQKCQFTVTILNYEFLKQKIAYECGNAMMCQI